MSSLALILVAAYALAILALARGRAAGGAADYLLAGRRLTLPAFVATLVTTWYGGILGIGEYAWRFGISTWVVFGLPYYLAAPDLRVLARTAAALDVGDVDPGPAAGRLRPTGPAHRRRRGLRPDPAGGLRADAGDSAQPAHRLADAGHRGSGAAFSALYVGVSGFRSVVRTDLLQLVLMYAGFGVLLAAALGHTGGLAGLWSSLPAEHRSWEGGRGWQAVLVWYLIALQTMVEPAFYQRVFAARTPAVARTGVVLSVAMWALFDFLSIGCGLAARSLLPGLDDPLAAYPALAELVLSPWLAAFFTLALFATVMSTLDSYLFLAAATVGHDLACDTPGDERERLRTRWGLAVSAVLAAAGALLFDSVVAVWHHVGSVVTSALLLPVVAVHLPPRWRFTGGAATAAMVLAAAVALGWIFAGGEAGYPLGVEPMFPALAVSAACLGAGALRRRRETSSGHHP
jgi:solute:Na+ symporter, SSS family